MLKKLFSLLSVLYINLSDSHYLRASNNYLIDNSSYVNDDIKNINAVSLPNGYLIEEFNCKNFKVGPGTTCGWIENYCEEQLGTSEYYFKGKVCNTEEPVAGRVYTCCEN